MQKREIFEILIFTPLLLNICWTRYDIIMKEYVNKQVI